ncbi:hypothetical protein DPMN_099177 [Dreissena polymorpha]|uniref:Uncharacterized protein n=1 Tax=Dreissena polymorpha TaxID=45954 RepID=A0A9D4LEE3_DREPO|nr:hypothetical protein DPMN_099177 [Dreissena polymorpha]
MAESNVEPTILDLMKQIKNVSDRLESVEKKIDGRDSIEKKFHLRRLEDTVDGADIHAAPMSELSDTLSEDNATGSESPETTECRLRQHLHDAFTTQRDVKDSIRSKRVDRSPGSPISSKVLNIVVTFK